MPGGSRERYFFAFRVRRRTAPSLVRVRGMLVLSRAAEPARVARYQRGVLRTRLTTRSTTHADWREQPFFCRLVQLPRSLTERRMSASWSVSEHLAKALEASHEHETPSFSVYPRVCAQTEIAFAGENRSFLLERAWCPCYSSRACLLILPRSVCQTSESFTELSEGRRRREGLFSAGAPALWLRECTAAGVATRGEGTRGERCGAPTVVPVSGNPPQR